MAVETPSLLIIHQNVNMAKTLATLLTKEYNVYIAQLTSNVSELIISNKIQLVLASQQLPDGTGLALFSELRRSHPEVVRILLVPEADRDNLHLEEALTAEIIHRYLTEPLRGARFLEIIRKGIELYAERTGSVAAHETVSQSPKAHVSAKPEDAMGQDPELGEAVSGSLDQAASAESGAEALESASLSYAAVHQQQREKQHLLDRLEEKQQRIEQLEAVRKELLEDREQLLGKVTQFQKENAALMVLRQENANLKEEADRLRAEVSLLVEERKQSKDQLESLHSESQKTQGELERLREQMESLGMLKTLTPTSAVTYAELQQSIDPMEIYTKAAEWCTQVSQLQRLNSVLDLKLRNCEAEIARLHQEVSGRRSRFENEHARLVRQSRELEEQVKDLNQRSKIQEASYNRLQLEREELAREVHWMQSQWKAKLSQGGGEA